MSAVLAKPSIAELAQRLADEIAAIADLGERVAALNEARAVLSGVSPFSEEPVDFVRWVPADSVAGNDYNPNAVAPPEMELLAHSILMDGYTQPIVTWKDGDSIEVVDGFHRNRVGKENVLVAQRVHGHLPVVQIRDSQSEKNHRIASTIRHNRARGKHQVDAMSDIVVELKRRNWANDRIAKELGMDQDEILRLCQITGLAELFADSEFSAAWEVHGEQNADDLALIIDDTVDPDEFRKVHSGGKARIFHTFDQWECYKAGFYDTTCPGKSRAQCEEEYRDFLSDLSAFGDALKGVTSEWVKSCEHYLTNESMNRIAWLGQAAACYALAIPACFRSGFWLLSEKQQEDANLLALEHLNRWRATRGDEHITLDEAMSSRQADIY